MWRYASSCVFLGALAAFGTSRAFAADPPCSPIAVAVDASVRARWPQLSWQVRQAFEARTDIDPCARVELAMNEGSIAVAVTLPDGRSASRQVSGREDVLPTLEALLLVPRPAAALGLEASSPSIPGPASTEAMQATAPTRAVQAIAVPVTAVHAAVPGDENGDTTGVVSAEPSSDSNCRHSPRRASVMARRASAWARSRSSTSADGLSASRGGRIATSQSRAETGEPHLSSQPWGVDVFAFRILRWIS